MNLLAAILLGILQGLTEFLPISSSAHLVIAQSLLPQFFISPLLFDLFLHLGTLAAVTFFLRREVVQLLFCLAPYNLRKMDYNKRKEGQKIIVAIIEATFVTGLIGFTLKSKVEKLFSSPAIASALLLVTGILLWMASRIKKNERREKDLNALDSFLIGLAQGIAVLPGISRSGATISMGIFRGLEREAAARFSFLLSIPAILGAFMLEARAISPPSLGEIEILGGGFLAAAVTGFLSLRFLFWIIKKGSLNLFAYYCFLVGSAFLFLSLRV